MNQPRYVHDEKVRIHIRRSEADFDRATDQAYVRALSIFGVTVEGHFTEVRESKRSDDTLVVSFTGYQCRGSMAGIEHIYDFQAWVEKYKDDHEKQPDPG